MDLDPFPPLYPILDVDVARQYGWDPVELGEAYVAGGARLLQLRAKSASGKTMFDMCDALVKRVQAAGTCVIMNDRPDVALLARADGVHLGQDDLPADAVRSLLGRRAIIGLSTHSVEQVDRGTRSPIDYVAVGPVFATVTKDTGCAAVGLSLVKDVVRKGRGRPVVAIGGITLEHAPAVLAAGAASVAVISDLVASGDPATRVRMFLTALRNTRA